MAHEDVSFEDAMQGVNQIDTGIGSEHYMTNGFNAAFCDGSIHFISDEIDLKVLRTLLTIAGGESVSHDQF